MSIPLANWPARRLRRIWGAGLLIEALLLVMFVLFVRPEPPLVEMLRRDTRVHSVVMIIPDSGRGTSAATGSRGGALVPPPNDSFYTVLHWPLHQPLLAGGGHVVAVPTWLWWVPVLYVGAVPFGLLALTGLWLRARRRAA